MAGKGEKFGVGIIGGGNWARHWPPAMEDSDILNAVAVTVRSRVPDYAETFNLKAYDKIEDFLADESIQLVCVITQHQVHAKFAIMAMEHGKHVIVEKPMAVTVEECDRMIEAAEKNKVKLQVAHSRRFFPMIRKAKQILDSGELGKILMMRSSFSHAFRPPHVKDGETHWIADPERGRSFFFGYGCHHIDYLPYLIGSRCQKVYARMENYWTDVDTVNAGMILLDFENGAYSTYWELDTVSPNIKEWPPFPSLEGNEGNEIVCEKGLMILEPYRRLLIRKNGKWEKVLELPQEEADPVPTFLRQEMEALAEAVRTDTDPPCTGEDGRHTVEICLAAVESSRKRQVIELKTSPKFDKRCDPLYYD